MVKYLVKKASEVEEMDLEGGGKIRWLITHRDGADKFSMRLILIPKGKNSPDHEHDYEHEMFIIEGEGEAILDNKRIQVGKDSFLFIPGGVHHTIKAISNLKLICMIPTSAAIKILGK
jgi:quercetin dioxygenase-like cupin family protein